MRITASTVSLTVEDIAASRSFFTEHLGYQEQAAAEGFASLTRDDAAVDIVLLRRGIGVLPPDQRDRQAGGLILAFTVTVTGLEAEEKRLRSVGVDITMPLREGPWGERLFQITDPNGVIVQFVEWTTPDHS
ncbi:VOC family protein [Streptomyces sp. NBC_00299]|uniref:VOC family protein n=1 Tax=Streptomyces sp. NBC_00299 TaxID=2975705 RepID=UPI002E2D41BB|nr:VOC family protein [Streptomyces sp. NBC_00299]